MIYAEQLAVKPDADVIFIDREKYEELFEAMKKMFLVFDNASGNHNSNDKKKEGTTEKCIYYTAADVAEMLGCCESYAYKIIRGLNKELQKKGYIVTAGKVPKQYFEEKYYGYESRKKARG